MRIFATKVVGLGIACLLLAGGLHVESAWGQDMLSVGCKDPGLKLSKFKRWVRPDYPEASRVAQKTGVVEVHVEVNEGGTSSTLKLSSDPQSDALEGAVKDVVEHWRYIVPITKTCEPLTSRVHARVHFNLEDGRPAVSLEEVSSPKAEKACVDPLRVLNEKEVREKLSLLFPRAARRSGSEGVVYLAITANAATGDVRDIDVVRLVDGGSAKREFQNVAMIAFRDLRVEPRVGSAPDETVRICRSVSFELRK
jgi:TonB family protein